MNNMNEEIFKSKPALPNKLLQADGSVTDLAGNAVIGAVDAYENKTALPNKWLNPDGTYSTLAEIVASMIDTELFIVVEELPASGESNKIYLLVQDDKLIEYIWVNNKWDPVGMVEFDINNYYTKDQVTQLISVALNSAKSYADGKAATAEANAKAYADTLVGSTETTVKDYADEVGTSAVTSANDYTDNQIEQKITQVLGGSY